MGLVKNKRGFSVTIMIFFFVFLAFFLSMLIGVGLYATNQVDQAFASIDFNIGNVSFNQTYNETLAPALKSFSRVGDSTALALIIGMVLVQILVGFFYSTSRLWILLDIGILIVSFIVAVILSQAFDTFINSSPVLLDIFSIDLDKSSTLILNLPAIVAIAGILTMVVTYGITRKSKQEQPDVTGF